MKQGHTTRRYSGHYGYMEAHARERRCGRELRQTVPRKAHAAWSPAANRPDPLGILEAQNATRLPELVPVRWGRMLESPFAFLRGSAAVMAMDLSTSPVTGINVQACGDAHVANFGLFASPERNLLFDVNDFDETHSGPWEWDLKRMTASAVVAARGAGLTRDEQWKVARNAARSYRLHMARYGRMPLVDIWYSKVDAKAAVKLFGTASVPIKASVASARRHTSAAAMPKLTELVRGGTRRIVDHPPLITHEGVDEHTAILRALFDDYVQSLDDAHSVLMRRFKLVDIALKVVGVGSVGTRCFVALLESDVGDPLLLQVKEARASVLAANLPHLPHGAQGKARGHVPRLRPVLPQGRRVVAGQKIMQAAADSFLGWSMSRGIDYYIRQLRDMKGSIVLSTLDARSFSDYVELCGWALARAHARSLSATRLAGYLGGSAGFDDAIAAFALAYADQTDADYALLVDAVAKGRIEARTGV